MDYATIQAQCLNEGKKFKDTQFPAENSSIYYSKTDDDIVWKRPGELCDDPQFTVDGASKYDLDQGKLGNCWFLAAAAVLTTQEDLFQHVVPIDQNFGEEYAGIFRFHFWRFGRWEEVIIDDRLPTKGGRLLFCRNRECANEFWSALLEKAYAKVHGSYQALVCGYSHDALVDFTGGIGEFIDLKTNQDHARLYKFLARVFKRNSLLCCAIEGDGEETLDNGLVSGHAYSITAVLDVDVEGAKQKLMRLRNPWGKKEWTGAWSDGSTEWEQIPEEKRTELGLTVEDDGEFWMPFADVLEYFHTLQICHLTPDCVRGGGGKKEWHVSQFHGEWVKGVTAGGCGAPPNQAPYWLNPQYYVRLQDVDEDDDDAQCTLVVSLMQKYARARRTTEKTDDTECAIGFDLYKYKGEAPEELTSLSAEKSALRVEQKMYDYEYHRERTCRFRLSPGVYGIIPATYDPGVEAPFFMRVATEVPAETGEVDDSTGPVDEPTPPKQRPFDRLFQKHAGDDHVVDARELRKILNQGLMRDERFIDKDEDFSKETARALIQSMSSERRGTLDHPDCKEVWRKVKKLQGTFDEFDADKSGELDIKELRGAFRSIGYKMSKKALVGLVNRYCGKGDFLSLDDFVLCATKTANSYETFKKSPKKRGQGETGDKIELTLEEFMALTV